MVIQVSGTRIIGPNTVVIPDPDPDPVVTMLMGCSASANDHGGTEVWDGWRIYKKSPLYTYANRTGNRRPKFVAYSIDGGDNIGGTNPTYNNVYTYALNELNEFYYLGGATSQVRSDRWGIKLFWSNGNENHDKGVLAPPLTQDKINLYAVSMRGLYDAVHYIDPSTGQRRFPDAYAGSNPTQNAEQQNLVAAWLHPSAQYHDFVMWSMYPPGRQNTESDPTYNWPSFTESDRTNSTRGFLIRCFYRTKQAEAQARIDRNDPTFKMMIGCGEVGIGDDPDDGTTRPYYAVHGLAHGMLTLSEQYQLPMPFACWWDNQDGVGAPENILSDEPVGLDPSTRVAWQNHLTYNHRRGGTHPASWAGNPKSSWKQSGTPL